MWLGTAYEQGSGMWRLKPGLVVPSDAWVATVLNAVKASDGTTKPSFKRHMPEPCLQAVPRHNPASSHVWQQHCSGRLSGGMYATTLIMVEGS
ncbi:MAG: hypothetical protein ACKPKO_32535, partial [Candidatus Fonsibacter sp.]